MKRLVLLFTGLLFLLSGCVARTYQLTQDRIDQSLTEGNRGYITGSHPGTETPRKSERSVRVFEFELGKSHKAKGSSPSAMGYTQPEQLSSESSYVEETVVESSPAEIKYQAYTVGKNDTLQKISQKFYGTTKKWNKIYQANPSLRGPDKIFPGQVLDIPVEGKEALKEPVENLK